VAVIEAGEISGALITAKMAFEQSREVFAIPGRLTDRMSAGTNDLIAKNMAHLLRDYSDILQEMRWVTAKVQTSRPAVLELYGKELEVFELMSAEPVHFDSLSEKTGMHTGELSATLTMLELGGVITRLPGDWYCLEGQAVTVR
jgi:DNA processing protein